MTDYVKSTNFASKDSLSSGNPLKIVKGTEIDTEFNNIATAVATKADLNSPTLIGTPTAPTASSGTNTTQIATTAFVSGSVTTERTATATLTNKSLTSPALTGTPTAPTASSGTNTTQISTTAFVTAAITAAKEALYPVGSIYVNAGVTTNPGTLLGFGTWVAFGAGRVMVGLNGSDSLFDALEETGGSKDAVNVSHTHTASASTVGDHSHSINNAQGAAGLGGYAYGASNDNYSTIINSTGAAGSHSHTITVDSAGSSGTNANLQPYITVAMWKRTA